MFIFLKMFPFTQNRVGARRAAGRENALTSCLLSSARHNLTCIFVITANLMKNNLTPKHSRDSWQLAGAPGSCEDKTQSVQRSHWKIGDTLHLETPSFHSQPWLPIAFCIMSKCLSLFLELIFLRPYVEDMEPRRESCQVCACESCSR